MAISSIGGSPGYTPIADPMATALSGALRAQNQFDAAGQELAAGNLDPAVVIDVQSDELSFAVNTKVMKTADDMTKQLLDVMV